MKIILTPTFEKQWKKLPSMIKQRAYKKEKIFRNNPFNLSLKTHKLSGKLDKYWSFSIDYHYRIVFRFIDRNSVLFVDIGTHEVY